MGAGDADYIAPRDDIVLDEAGARGVGKPLVQHVLDYRHASLHGVPDHDEIRRIVELLLSVALGNLDSLAPQLVAHGRIDIPVRACNFEAELARDEGDAAHEGTADAENMNMHESPRFFFNFSTGAQRRALPRREVNFRNEKGRIPAPSI